MGEPSTGASSRKRSSANGGRYEGRVRRRRSGRRAGIRIRSCPAPRAIRGSRLRIHFAHDGGRLGPIGAVRASAPMCDSSLKHGELRVVREVQHARGERSRRGAGRRSAGHINEGPRAMVCLGRLQSRCEAAPRSPASLIFWAIQRARRVVGRETRRASTAARQRRALRSERPCSTRSPRAIFAASRRFFTPQRPGRSSCKAGLTAAVTIAARPGHRRSYFLSLS